MKAQLSTSTLVLDDLELVSRFTVDKGLQFEVLLWTSDPVEVFANNDAVLATEVIKDNELGAYLLKATASALGACRVQVRHAESDALLKEWKVTVASFEQAAKLAATIGDPVMKN